MLVVDDSAVVRQSFAMLLSKHFTIDTAADPIIAARKMEKKRPDVVVLDLQMPRLDGAAAAREIALMCPAAKIVLLSGADGADSVADGERAIAFFVSKAASLAELPEIVAA